MFGTKDNGERLDVTMAKKEEPLLTAARAYLATLEASQAAGELSDSERVQADREAEIEYMKAHCDALENA